jgi:FlaA1/EpsC-like NDP-sugar epimerase
MAGRRAGRSLKRAWLRAAPLDLFIPFVLLLLFRSYSRVWYLARVSEYAATGLAVALGYAVACGLHLLGAGTLAETAGWALHYLLLAGLAAPAMVLTRAALRVVQDLMQWRTRGFGPDGDARPRALVCGAGYRTTLFLRQIAFRARDRTTVNIVGIVSEDAAITGHDVHGIRVLGTCHELPALVIRLHRRGYCIWSNPWTKPTWSSCDSCCGTLPLRVIRWDIVESEVSLSTA